MPTSRRWKRLFLLGAGVTTLAVILWATYVFTATWLRVRCVRELAEQAEPHGKADQLVFGTRAYVNDQNGVFALRVTGPGVVCIVEDGELKTVRSISTPLSQANETQAGVPPDNP